MDDNFDDTEFNDLIPAGDVSKEDKDRVKSFKLKTEVRNSVAGCLDLMVGVYDYQISEVIAEIVAAADELEKEFKA